MADQARLAAIPLRCWLCPKRPRFSDLSHLLTHVASKGHLSQQFKVSVRASTDDAAKETLNIYNDWYEKNGIEKLCATRLRSNETRKAKLESCSGTGLPKKGASKSAKRGGLKRSVPAELHAEHCIRGPAHALDCCVTSSADAQQGHHHRAHTPRMHLWPTDAERLHAAPKPVNCPRSATISPCSVTSDGGSSHAPLSGVHVNQNSVNSLHSFTGTESGMTENALSAGMGDELGPADGESQLKGVFWPGMSIFDSAPPDMRRKRNQRKDGSILAQMQLNSTLVEPTEFVFFADGDLKKQRRIYAQSEPSSVEDNEQSKKRRSSKPSKGILTEASVNVPRRSKAPKARKASCQSLDSEASRPRDGRFASAVPRSDQRSEPYGSATGLGHYVGFYEDHGQHATAVPKRRSNFIVFQDGVSNLDGGHTKTSSPSSDEGHISTYPRGLTLLNSGLPFPGSGEDPVPDPCQLQITSFFKPVFSDGPAKHSFGSFVPYQGHHDQDLGRPAPERRTQPGFSNAEDYGSHTFASLPPVEFGTFDGASAYTFSNNPLAFASYYPVHDFQLPQVGRGPPTGSLQRSGFFAGGSPRFDNAFKPERGQDNGDGLFFQSARG